jgi:Helicase associated domain
MSTEPSNETKRIRDRSEPVQGATPKAESASVVAGQNGLPVDALLDHITLCHAYRNNFIHPQLSMLEALSQQVNTVSSQVQMSSFLNPVNHPLLDTYFPNFYDYNSAQNYLSMSTGDGFLRQNQVKQPGEIEYSKSVLYLAERQLLQNASTQAWTQSVQRNLVSNGSGHVHTASGSILQGSHSGSQSDWVCRPTAASSLRRNPAEAAVQVDRSISKRLSSSGEDNRINDSQKQEAALKQVEMTPSVKTSKGPKLDSRWLSSLDELKQFKQANGHTIVPRGYSENPKLASWVCVGIAPSAD